MTESEYETLIKNTLLDMQNTPTPDNEADARLAARCLARSLADLLPGINVEVRPKLSTICDTSRTVTMQVTLSLEDDS